MAAAALTEDLIVSKGWCRLICRHGFRRRFRVFHGGTPPLLGLVHRDHGASELFVPVSSFRPRDHADDRRDMKAVHSCHGRVLFHSVYPFSRRETMDLFVWHPIMDKLQKLPRWPQYSDCLCSQCCAAVLCADAVAGDNGCDHLDCNHGPFLVVLAGMDKQTRSFICVYSSEADRWSDPIYAGQGQRYHNIEKGNCVLIGNAIYFKCFAMSTHEPAILKYDLLTQEISLIHIPRVGVQEQIVNPDHIVLMPMEDGRLGFVGMRNWSTLSLWSRVEHGPNDEDARWAQSKISRVIEHDTLLNKDYLKWTHVVAFADTGGGRIIFIWSCGSLLSFNLKSGSSKVVRQRFGIGGVVPYVNFCTPALGAVSIDEGSGVGGTCA